MVINTNSHFCCWNRRQNIWLTEWKIYQHFKYIHILDDMNLTNIISKIKGVFKKKHPDIFADLSDDSSSRQCVRYGNKYSD